MNKKILILEELKRYAIDTANRIRKLSTEKVDKQDGKGLSSNDFTTSEKEKLKDISVATEDKPGLVKPDGDTITMDMDGTLHGTTIDELFSLTSTNPVQNKVVKAKFDEIEEKVNANETTISSNTNAINTLNGDGEGSVKKTVTDEITKVVADAPESLDTLKEISDWISGHEDDASAMNSAISDNKTAITALQTGKADKSEIPTTIAELTDSADYAKTADVDKKLNNKADKTEIPTELPANGGNADTVNGHTVDIDVPSDAKFTDTTYSDATQIEHGLMSADDKKKLDGLTKYTPDGSTITADEDGTLHGQSVDIMTVDKAGIGKPDGDTIEVSTDATISVSSKALTFSDHDTATSGTSFTDAEDGNMIVTDWTKNLLNPTLETTTQNGVTCTNNGDGTYTLNGKVIDRRIIIFNIGIYILEKNKTYKFIGMPDLGLGFKCYVDARRDNDTQIQDIGSGDIYTSKNGQTGRFMRIIIDGERYSDIVLNNILIKPMITTDLSATYDDFVPYGGYEIQSCGKNLFNPTLETVTKNGITCTNNGDGTYTLNGTSNGMFVNNYVGRFILDKYDGSKLNCLGQPYGFYRMYLYFGFFDSDNKRLFELNPGTRYDSNRSEDCSNVKYVDVGIFGDLDEGEKINTIIKPMITTDLSATYDDFEPYTGETIKVTNDTESPAFGLKSHKGITNIISPGNVKCVYPTNESGKGVLDAMYNNSQLSNELSKLKNAILAMGGTV